MTDFYDHDLYLIHEDLRRKKVRDNALPIHPLPVGLPDRCRVYLVDITGDVRFAFKEPTAGEVLYFKWLSIAGKDDGDVSVYIMKRDRIADCFHLNATGLLSALSVMSERNVFRAAYQQRVRDALSDWKQAEVYREIGLSPDDSDEDILNFLYKDIP